MWMDMIKKMLSRVMDSAFLCWSYVPLLFVADAQTERPYIWGVCNKKC